MIDIFGIFKSKSEKLVNKAYKLSKEIWATQKKLTRDPSSDFWTKYLIDTWDHFNEVTYDLENLKDKEYVENLLSNLEKEYESSPHFITEEQAMFVDDLISDYRLKNKYWFKYPENR